ncbi:glycosyltransferase family 2 protein [Priestia aryabhattai]|uniref:glycosyltransferase family 2 protein n=1 Tax=Priestia aryabhattai TaxID=412384 RepID=UPI003D2A2F51
MSKISVIIPVYNAGNKLHKCIKSILNQTFTNFELLLVNDGSTDNSLSICKKYSQMDKRIRLISKENRGSIEARKTGVKNSNTDLIMFVDADDWVSNLILQTLYDSLLGNNADISICNIYKVLGSGKLIKKEFNNRYFINNKLYNEDEIKSDLVTAYFHGHPFPSSLCAKLYKKELLVNAGKYLDRIKFLGDDLFYNLEVFMKAKRVKMIDKPLYFYRAGGFTSKCMPHLFEDAINGYLIQKEVINEHYQDVKQKEMMGASIMLLNTFKTCLHNLFNSNFTKEQIESIIKQYTLNTQLLEGVEIARPRKYFDDNYLDAIEEGNTEYLYRIGKNLNDKMKPRRTAVNILSKIC